MVKISCFSLTFESYNVIYGFSIAPQQLWEITWKISASLSNHLYNVKMGDLIANICYESETLSVIKQLGLTVVELRFGHIDHCIKNC